LVWQWQSAPRSRQIITPTPRQWHCATVPRQRLPACRRPRYVVAPALGINTRSRYSSIMAVHCRRPCLSRGRGTSVEQSARIRHGVNVAAHVQATPEVCTVCEKLLNTGCFQRLEHVPSHVILFAFNFVLCPCSRSDIMPP